MREYWNGALLSTFKQAGDHALRLVGHFAGEQFVKDQTQREEVRTLVEIFAECLLRGHVIHGSDQSAGLGHPHRLQSASQTKVHDHDAALFVPHDVLRLQVAVDDAFAVSSFESAAGLEDDLHRLLWSKLFVRLQKAVQVLALDILHGDELDSSGFTQIENTNHVPLRNLAGENQLLLEALDDGRIAGQVGADDLECD